MNKAYYAIIPANVRYDKELTPNAKLLYGEITALCNEKGYCWASNKYFAELYGVSTVSISKWVNQLAKKGYIGTTIAYEDGTKEIKERRIYISTPIKEKFNTPIRKVKDPIKEKFNTPIKEKFKDNNTLFNNTTNTTTNNSDDDIFKKIVQAFEQNGFGTINLTTKEMIVDLVEVYSGEWTLEAIEIAVKNNARNLNYVEGILKRWRAKGKDAEKERKVIDPYAGLEVY